MNISSNPESFIFLKVAQHNFEESSLKVTKRFRTSEKTIFKHSVGAAAGPTYLHNFNSRPCFAFVVYYKVTMFPDQNSGMIIRNNSCHTMMTF